MCCRLAPEHPFPAALQDVVLSFLHLIDQNEGYGYDPENIMIMGDSAGGGLALSMMLYMRDHGLPLPGAASLLSVCIHPVTKEYLSTFS
jgi:acetyl esterase/lipase